MKSSHQRLRHGNFVLHPYSIIKRKIDSILKTSTFYFQNLGLKYFNSKIFFFSIKKSNFSYVQINLILEDEIFSKHFYKNMAQCLGSYKLSYFLNGEGSIYPSICNLKYFGKEFLICNNLQFNKLADKIILNKTQIRKINERTFCLIFKEILTFTINPSIFSTIARLDVCNLKNLLKNEECIHISFFFEKTNSISTVKRSTTFFEYRKEFSCISNILLEISGAFLIGLPKKNLYYWFRLNIKNKFLASKNFVFSNKVRKNASVKKMHQLNFIFLSNLNDEIYMLYFLKLRNLTEWANKEIIQGLKENDLNSKHPTSLDTSFFVQKKINNFIFSSINNFLRISYEMFESQFLNYVDHSNSNHSSKNWKKRGLCIENNFNKLIFKISNSAFKHNEINLTNGIVCTKKNLILFNGLQSQKIYNDNLTIKKNFKFSQISVTKKENFKTYKFSIGSSSNYSKF